MLNLVPWKKTDKLLQLSRTAVYIDIYI
eukprot:SAG31_NODE_13492_length_864_cov_1.640992_1_plen_27_part_10